MSRPSWVGKTLGERYLILEVVGQGGMSSVYKAKDPNLQRMVAVKMIHPHLSSDPKFISRFEEEARAVAQLRHPNIVQVFDFNHDDDIYYMVQEFVPGETLQARLRRLNKADRRMELDESIRHSRYILDAMSYAHQRGMIHRDIKPANIMLDVQGQAILMDFGIVKIMGGETHTATGAVVGTAMYMSPELIRGEPPDERSDIYSLGITLFEMVSGHPPYEAESAMTLMMMHLNDPIPDLHSLRPEVPDDMIFVIQKALAKDKSARFSSAAEMSAALKKILDRIEGGIPFESTMIDSSPIVKPGDPNQPSSDSNGPDTSDASGKLAAGIAVAGVAGAASTLQPETDVELQTDDALAPPESATQIESDQPALGETSGTLVEPSITANRGGEARAAPLEGGHPASQQSNPQGASIDTAGGYGAGSPPSEISSTGSDTDGKRSSSKFLYIGLGVVGVIAIILLGIYIGSRMGNSSGEDLPVVAEVPSATQEVIDTSEPSATIEPTSTITPTPTETSLPTLTPTLTALPTVVPPPGVKFVRINGIDQDDQNRYVVNYETFEYTEVLPGEHVHFFFNTVSQENAGSPGSGPWQLYGGPRPFMLYTANQRPSDAAAMCALVANPNHSIQIDSGACWPLPDQVVLTALQDTVCLNIPDRNAEQIAELAQWTMLLVKERTADNRWWNIQNPDNLSETCWTSIDNTYVTGDFEDIPVNAQSGGPDSAYTVVIQDISLDAQYNFVVNYETTGFTEAENNLHIHFFFDSIPPEEAGMPANLSNWFVYYGPRPFTGYNLSDKPEDATQLCALVANADHTVIQETGNCVPLP